MKSVFTHANDFWQFTPTYTTNFETRMLRWINNNGLTDEDRRILLSLILEIQFIDRDDMLALYRHGLRAQRPPMDYGRRGAGLPPYPTAA